MLSDVYSHRNLISLPSSKAGFTGFARKSSIPAAAAFSRSAGDAFAVRAIMGMFARIRFGSLRMFMVDSYPSITGISISINTKWK